jgi:pyruvate dehydrogenase E1 component alpha subunit
VLRTLYSMLLKTRLLEEQVLACLKAGTGNGISASTLGGEATEVGACIGLQPGDSFSYTKADLAVHVVLGTPLEHVLADTCSLTRKPRRSQPREPTKGMHVVPRASTITGQLSVAAGIALAYRNLGAPSVVVALANDALAALGSWHEAATLASQERLPIIFMVENCAQSHPNGASTVHSDEDLRDRAESYGIPGITVDGNDIVAVWRVTQESIHRARTGAGPTLIECRTWRWLASPSNLNGNDRSLFKPPQARWQNDPLRHMEHYMKKRKLWNKAWSDELFATFREQLRKAEHSWKG